MGMCRVWGTPSMSLGRRGAGGTGSQVTVLGDSDEELDPGDKGGEAGGDKGGEKEGDTGGEKGGAGSKDAPRQPPTTQEG